MSENSRIRRLREEILREWRGADEPADLNGRVHQPEKFIRAILKQAGVAEGVDESQLRSAWKELAGDFVAAHSEPVSIRDGHLVLRVAQPAMRFHLEQMKPMLLKRIREALGADRVRSIRFQTG